MIFNVKLLQKKYSPEYVIQQFLQLEPGATKKYQQLDKNRKEGFMSYTQQYLAPDVLIGREPFLDTLRTNLNRLQTDTNTHIAFVGKRGVGKTALARRFLMGSSELLFDDHIPNIFFDHTTKKQIQSLNDASASKSAFFLPCYIDLETIAMTPEQFAIEYVGTFCYLGKDDLEQKKDFQDKTYSKSSQISSFTRYINIDFLLSLQLPRALHDIIFAIQNELEKITPNQTKLMSLAFSFPRALAQEIHKKLVIIIDNFHRLYELNNYKKINPIEKEFEKHLTNSFFILLSDQEPKLRATLSEFEVTPLTDLNQSETYALIDSLLTKQQTTLEKNTSLDHEDIVRLISPPIYEITKGNPFLIRTLITDWIKNLSVLQPTLLSSSPQQKISFLATEHKEQYKKHLQSIVPFGQSVLEKDDSLLLLLTFYLSTVESLLYEEGTLNLFYKAYLDRQLERARGKTLLQSILGVLSNQPEDTTKEPIQLRLSDIAREIYRSPPVTKNLLLRLMEVNLITSRHNVYFIPDQLLRRWYFATSHYMTIPHSLITQFETLTQAYANATSVTEKQHISFLLTCFLADLISYTTMLTG